MALHPWCLSCPQEMLSDERGGIHQQDGPPRARSEIKVPMSNVVLPHINNRLSFQHSVSMKGAKIKD